MIEKIKIFIKNFLGTARAHKNGIILEEKVYIGKHCNIKGEKNIILDRNVTIRPETDIWITGELKIGEGSEIGERNRISISHNCIIGKNVLLSPNVYITDCDHEYRDVEFPIMNQGIVEKANSVKIMDNAYIGINSVIVGNVIIGKGSVIGANSVVTKSIPSYCVAVGSPARVIKRYNNLNKQWEKVKN